MVTTKFLSNIESQFSPTTRLRRFVDATYTVQTEAIVIGHSFSFLTWILTERRSVIILQMKIVENQLHQCNCLGRRICLCQDILEPWTYHQESVKIIYYEQ